MGAIINVLHDGFSVRMICDGRLDEAIRRDCSAAAAAAA